MEHMKNYNVFLCDHPDILLNQEGENDLYSNSMGSGLELCPQYYSLKHDKECYWKANTGIL